MSAEPEHYPWFARPRAPARRLPIEAEAWAAVRALRTLARLDPDDVVALATWEDEGGATP